jgi:hypothetical protein
MALSRIQQWISSLYRSINNWSEVGLSEESLKKRRNVLGTSCILVATKIWNLTPTEIPALGIKDINATVPLPWLFLVVHAYFLLGFYLHSHADVKSSRRAYTSSEFEAKLREPISWVFFLRYIYDFWLPSLFGCTALLVFFL